MEIERGSIPAFIVVFLVIAVGLMGMIMLSAAYPELGIHAPAGPSGLGIHLHVDDADALLARAAEAGGTVLRPAQTQFYGERSGTFRDPFGHEWMVDHSVEEVSPAEMQRRWVSMAEG